MPKLKSTIAKKVEKAEAATGSFLLPEGRYAARLVEVQEKQGPKGPYWVWVLADIHDEDGNAQPGRQWHNTSLSDAAFGFLKAVFNAFGYTPDSNTDEMIGEWVTLHLVQEQIAMGKRAGEMTNRIRDLFEFDGSNFNFDPADLPEVKRPNASGEATEY